MGRIVEPNGRITWIAPSSGRTFSLRELQAAIGGWYIELLNIVANGREQIMVVYDENHQKNLPVNKAASNLYNGKDQSIVGIVLICEKNEIDRDRLGVHYE